MLFLVPEQCRFNSDNAYRRDRSRMMRVHVLEKYRNLVLGYLSMLEAGKLTLDSQPFRIDLLMRDLSVILLTYVGTKRIKVSFDKDSAAFTIQDGPH